MIIAAIILPLSPPTEPRTLTPPAVAARSRGARVFVPCGPKHFAITLSSTRDQPAIDLLFLKTPTIIIEYVFYVYIFSNIFVKFEQHGK